MANRDAALTRAIKEAGNSAKLAAGIGISPQALSQWDKVPPLRVLAVERISGVSREELRPDLYTHGAPTISHAPADSQEEMSR
jgi:DNA-binding transcriptional regulator YdaS (Cro superfamily)